MNILYTFLNFNRFTGSELYYYELAREMVLLGHNVTIVSNCGGEIEKRAIAAGVRCKQFSELNDFREFDIIHASHLPVINGLYNSSDRFICPVVVTCHSEIIDVEQIPDNENISHFIGIRPTIYNSLPENRRSLIFNPIDISRFNQDNISDSGLIVFAGTFNILRSNAIIKLINDYKQDNVIFIGDDYSKAKSYGINLKYINSFWNIENLIKSCRFSAGIIKGRTYMESIFCGKKYLDFEVNSKGIITGMEMCAPGDYLEFSGKYFHKSEFYSFNVAKKIEKIYLNLI